MTGLPARWFLRKPLRTLSVLGLVTLVAWLGSSILAANRLSQRPRPPYEEQTPPVAWSDRTTLRLTTRDGEDLGAWYFPGPGREPGGKTPVVAVFHGLAGCRTVNMGRAELLAQLGCSVLLVTLRSHGDSTGGRVDWGRSSRLDVIAAVDWVQANHPGRPLVVWGESLGSAAALFAAGELGPAVDGYILECPFRDLPTAVRNRTRMYLPPVLDQVAYAGLLSVAPLFIPAAGDISPLRAMDDLPPTARVLLLTGTADRRATPAEAEEMAQRRPERTTLVVIDGGDHSQLEVAQPNVYRQAIADYFRPWTAQKP